MGSVIHITERGIRATAGSWQCARRAPGIHDQTGKGARASSGVNKPASGVGGSKGKVRFGRIQLYEALPDAGLVSGLGFRRPRRDRLKHHLVAAATDGPYGDNLGALKGNQLGAARRDPALYAPISCRVG